jgi:integrase
MTTTGCRVAEACRLTWRDVDFDRGTALLTRTKSGNPRRLVLGTNVVEALVVLQKQKVGQPGQRCFGFSTRFSVNTALKRACAKAGLKFYSSHKLGRHACAARLLARGHTLGETAKAMGWSDKSIALVHRVYGHLEQSKLDDAVRDAAEGLKVGGTK